MTDHDEKTQGGAPITSLLAQDLRIVAQAELFVAALTAPEQPLSDDKRVALLPLGVACALVHPFSDCAYTLKACPLFRLPGQQLWLELVSCSDGNRIWDHLAEPFKAHEHADEILHLFAGLRERWDTPAYVDAFLPEGLQKPEAHTFALLALVLGTGWHMDEQEPTCMFLKAQQTLCQWLDRQADVHQYHLADLLWARDQEGLPLPTASGEFIDILGAENEGPVKQRNYACVPLDLVLLEGGFDERNYYDFSTFASQQQLLAGGLANIETRMVRVLYDVMTFSELLSFGPMAFRRHALRFEARSRSHFLSLSRSQSRSPFRAQWLGNRLAKSPSRSSSPFRALFRILSQSRMGFRFSSNSGSSYRLPWKSPFKCRFFSRLADLMQAIAPESALSSKFLRLIQCCDWDKPSDLPQPLIDAFFKCSLKKAAWDWFGEPAEKPTLAKALGYRLGEPLPAELGLLDEKGLPRSIQNREKVAALLAWCDDPKRLLAWVAPDGLPKEKDAVVSAQLDLLRTRPWSPQVVLRAVLEDWPEEQPDLDCSLETAAKELDAVLDALLAEHDPASR